MYVCNRWVPCHTLSVPPGSQRRWSGTLSNFMKECTHHLCKRLVAEHYAAVGARNGSDSGASLSALGPFRRTAQHGVQRSTAGISCTEGSAPTAPAIRVLP